MGNSNENTGLKIVINYFDKTALISSAKEAVDFINTLSYRGNSHGITCSTHTEKLLNDIFNGEKMYETGKPFFNSYNVRTTGCGQTQINLYRALADTLEAHNEKVKQKKEIQEDQDKIKRNEREQAHLELMHEPLKGWYVVTITGNAFKLRGNDGAVTKSVKVLAENRMESYNKAVLNLEENPPKNVSMWYGFESSKSALIQYVGVWTDEAELEF